MRIYKSIFKPLSDTFLSLIMIILALPLFILISLILFASNCSSPFFLQQRPGRQGLIFKVIKFKTMNDRRDNHGNLLPDPQRLTHVGKIIRKSSLDELPQLINVLKGDMSFVGPRPLLPEYLPLYSQEQMRRHEVRPGITGWAQVNGRNALSWEEKFKLDLWYVDNISYKLDFKILWKTLLKVFNRENVYSAEGNTMEPFKGSCL